MPSLKDGKHNSPPAVLRIRIAELPVFAFQGKWR